MPYIGRSPQVGNYSKLDDISAFFNSSDTQFTLQVGAQDYVASTATQLLISIDGVLQEPNSAYTVTDQFITFTSPPATNASFFGVALGDTLNIGTPSDDAVSTVKLQDGSVTTVKIADDNVTFAKIADNAIHANTINTDAVTETKVLDGAITYNKLNANTAHTDRVQTFTVAQIGGINDLGVRKGAAGNTVTLTLTDSNHYKMVANSNLTIANPAGINAGQGGSIVVTANGNYTTSWGSYWRFATGVAPTMSTIAGKEDRIDYYVASSNTIHAVATIDLLGTA